MSSYQLACNQAYLSSEKARLYIQLDFFFPLRIWKKDVVSQMFVLAGLYHAL